MKSKKEALDDAISFTKAAVAEGIVPRRRACPSKVYRTLHPRRSDLRRRREDRCPDSQAGKGSQIRFCRHI